MQWVRCSVLKCAAVCCSMLQRNVNDSFVVASHECESCHIYEWVMSRHLESDVNDYEWAWMTHSTHVYVRGWHILRTYMCVERVIHISRALAHSWMTTIVIHEWAWMTHSTHAYVRGTTRSTHTYVIHICVYMCVAHMSFISESICAHICHSYLSPYVRSTHMCHTHTPGYAYLCDSDMNDSFHARLECVFHAHSWMTTKVYHMWKTWMTHSTHTYVTFHAHICDSDMTHSTHTCVRGFHVTQIWHIARTNTWLRYDTFHAHICDSDMNDTCAWDESFISESHMCAWNVSYLSHVFVRAMCHIWVTQICVSTCVCVWNESCVHAYVRARTDSFRCVYLHVCGIRHVYILMCVVIGLFCKRDP